MKRHRDALKRARQSLKRRLRNVSVISSLKTLRKNLATAATAETRAAALKRLDSAVNKAARKGIIHPNKAARVISRAARKTAKQA